MKNKHFPANAGVLLAEVILASLVVGLGLVSVFRLFGHLQNHFQRNEEQMFLAGTMESFFWEWRHTGKTPEGEAAGQRIETNLVSKSDHVTALTLKSPERRTGKSGFSLTDHRYAE